MRPASGINSKPESNANINSNATNVNTGSNKIASLLSNINNNSNPNQIENSNDNDNTHCTNSNETSSSSTLSIKDRLKLLNSGSSQGFPMPGAAASFNQPKPLNAPIQLNHNIQSSHLNKLNEIDKLKSAESDSKKAEEKAKTKEEIEEEKRLKRERMKLKMGNSTNKIIAKNKDKEKEAEKLKENSKDENNKVKNLANLLADKIHLGLAAKGQFDEVEAEKAKKSKLNRLFQGNEDVQFEQEEKFVDEEDEEVLNNNSNKDANKICIDKSYGNEIKFGVENINAVYEKKNFENFGKPLIQNINSVSGNHQVKVANEVNIIDQHQKDLDDEDHFMKQIENKPRMMTHVRKFKKPEFKLDK